MKTTHTYALLEVSAAAFREVSEKLRAAGYDHAFDADGNVIDMHGIALTLHACELGACSCSCEKNAERAEGKHLTELDK